MPKVHWLDIPRTTGRRLLVAKLPAGEADSPTSPALKEGLNLLSRVCTALRLEGRYALRGSRASGLTVELIFELGADADRFAAAAAMPVPVADDASLLIDGATAARLRTVGGLPDTRGRGRRRLEKEKDQRDALTWAQRPTGRSATRRDRRGF